MSHTYDNYSILNILFNQPPIHNNNINILYLPSQLKLALHPLTYSYICTYIPSPLLLKKIVISNQTPPSPTLMPALYFGLFIPIPHNYISSRSK